MPRIYWKRKAQTTIQFYVFDQDSNQPIPYAHAVNLNTNDGYLSNEEGLITFVFSTNKDTLHLSHLGYDLKKILAGSIAPNSTITLSPSAYSLETVSVTARDERAYTLLKKSKKRMRRIKNTRAKAFLSLETESEGKPIEFLQGHYNAEMELGSLESLELKAGRVALSQINDRYFVSLSTTHLLCNYSLINGGHLPFNPYQVRRPKRYFDMKVVGENEDEVILSFIPMKNKDKAFEGKLWIAKSDYSILRITLKNDNVATHPFRPIKPNDKLENLGINLNITFHPDINQGIKDLQFAYVFDYYFEHLNGVEQPTRRLKTNGYLFLYDNEKLFDLPLIEYKANHNDYRKISFLGFDPTFWNKYARITNTSSQIKKLEYFKNNGFIVNFYDNQFSDDGKVSTFFENNNIRWNAEERWYIKSKKIDLSRVEIIPKSKIEVQLFLDYYPIGDTMRYRSETILDVFTSEYYLPNTPQHNAFLNIYFDLCEIERRSLIQKLDKNASSKKIKELYEQTKDTLKKKLKTYSKKTNYGENLEALRSYNLDVFNALNINNFKYFGIID